MLTPDDRDDIAQRLMPTLLAQLFDEGMTPCEYNIYELAACRAYLGADALIARASQPPMAQPGPFKL